VGCPASRAPFLASQVAALREKMEGS